MLGVNVTGILELNVNDLYAISLDGNIGILKSAPLFILLFTSSEISSLINNTVFNFIPPAVPNNKVYLFPFNVKPFFEYLS